MQKCAPVPTGPPHGFPVSAVKDYRSHQPSGAPALGQIKQYGLPQTNPADGAPLIQFRPLAAVMAERGAQSHGRISGCARWWRPCPRPVFGQARRPSGAGAESRLLCWFTFAELTLQPSGAIRRTFTGQSARGVAVAHHASARWITPRGTCPDGCRYVISLF